MVSELLAVFSIGLVIGVIGTLTLASHGQPKTPGHVEAVRENLNLQIFALATGDVVDDETAQEIADRTNELAEEYDHPWIGEVQHIGGENP